MKLNEAQIDEAQTLIAAIVKYQETYEEVADHILTAIQELPENDKPFNEVLNEVINTSFGDKDNIRALEEQREKIVQAALKKKLWHNVLRHFKVPLIGFTILLAGVAYYTIDTYISRKIFFLLITLVAFCPAMILFVHWFSRKYLQPVKVKRSIKTSVAVTLAYMSLTTLNLVNFLPELFSDSDNYRFLIQANSAFACIIMVFFAVYTLSFIKLYQEQLRMQMV